MTGTVSKARLDRLVWILIYAGMFAIVLGIASRTGAPATAWTLIVIGALACLAGVVLIWLRARPEAEG